MPLEIERKFLLANDEWRSGVIRRDHLRDGLIGRFNGGKVRVRLSGDKAWLTVKGPRRGICRSEFEYEIPYDDGDQMVRTLCMEPVIEKIRHSVPFAGLIWSIDIHLGGLAGVEFAEVELSQPDTPISLPNWAGPEVTHEPRFRKENLMHSVKATHIAPFQVRTETDI